MMMDAFRFSPPLRAVGELSEMPWCPEPAALAERSWSHGGLFKMGESDGGIRRRLIQLTAAGRTAEDCCREPDVTSVPHSLHSVVTNGCISLA